LNFPSECDIDILIEFLLIPETSFSRFEARSFPSNLPDFQSFFQPLFIGGRRNTFVTPEPPPKRGHVISGAGAVPLMTTHFQSSSVAKFTCYSVEYPELWYCALGEVDFWLFLDFQFPTVCN
jgi:hypothetical protein